MVDDIVVLPSRLRQFKTDSNVSSEALCTLPLPAIPREYGYDSPNDDDWVQYGSATTCPAGSDALFRFKLIENTRKGLCEYFCVSQSPIDFYSPVKSRRTQIYCLWVTVTDRKMRVAHKYVLWRNVFALTHYETEDSTVDAPVEAVIAEEIRQFAFFHQFPEIAAEVRHYPKNTGDVLISEVLDSGIDQLHQLGANMRAFNNAQSLYSYYNPYDIFRGVYLPEKWGSFEPLSDCQVLAFVQFGPITLGDIIHLFSPYYRLHGYQRSFSQKDLNPYVIRDIESNDTSGLFSIIKYVERIPYSEFELRLTNTGTCDLKVYNQFNLDKVNDPEQSAMTKPIIDSIRLALNSGFPNWVEVTVARSWAEEVYITIVNSDRSVGRFYYDLSVTSLCSRSLIKDYSGTMFSLASD